MSKPDTAEKRLNVQNAYKFYQVSSPEARQERAMERKAARDSMTSAEQILELDGRLGKGKGAARERARLLTVPIKQAAVAAVEKVATGLTQEQKDAKKAATAKAKASLNKTQQP